MAWEEAQPCKEAMHLLWDGSPLEVPSEFKCPHIESPELFVPTSLASSKQVSVVMSILKILQSSWLVNSGTC